MPEHLFREVMSDDRLKPGVRVVYYWARELSDRDGFCYVPVTELARRSGIEPDTCSMHIQDLIKFGYLTRHKASGLGRGRRKIGIVGMAMTLFASAAIGAATPEASTFSSATMQSSQPFNFPATKDETKEESPLKPRRRRRRRHDDAA